MFILSLFCTKLAEFVLFLKPIIYNYLNACKAHRKILIGGGDQRVDGGGLRIFLMGGGQTSMGGTRVRWGGVPPPSPPYLITLRGVKICLAKRAKLLFLGIGTTMCLSRFEVPLPPRI